MRPLLFICAALLFMPAKFTRAEEKKTAQPAADFVLVIHGGAGVVGKDELTPEQEKASRATLDAALQAGHSVLARGGRSLDAVIAAIKILEDSPLFNAGKGSVLTADGTVTMDASLMDGATRQAGACADIRHVKNPIDLARLVMDRTPHVLLTGEGAELLAKEHGLPLMPAEYFITDHRKLQLQRVQQREKARKAGDKKAQINPLEAIGTVGAVALDKHGNLAAGTSTGGMVNKRFGRVGDSPIIGAGTYANNLTCAVSGTGHGEFFLRSVVAYDIAAKMEYQGVALTNAATEVVMRKLTEAGGKGGVIALDAKGNVAMPFNTEGMYRGVIRPDGKPWTAIRKD
ncbi:MAG: isoaspartyl peptidase/L-asparaginase [Proteobacteria bacterium]|nr:isoaspartyl peptidase/L-asparaginase [Pseudomonadota bacterium]